MKPTTLTLAIALTSASASASASITAAQPSANVALTRHAAAGAFTLVVKADGTVVGWGRDTDGQAARPASPRGRVGTHIVIDLPGKALQVALGELASYALLEDGTVVAWGLNNSGQLGNGPLAANGVLGRYPKPSITPVRVTGLKDIVQIAAGSKHAVALRQDGTVMAWGLNRDGQLGNGTRDNAWSPVEARGVDRVVAIAAGMASFAGNSFSGAVRDNGSVWTWGSGASGVMGNGTENPSPDDPGGRNLLPMQVEGLSNVKSLSLGFGHAAALLRDGTLRMWGFDGYGQIGVGTAGGYYSKPVSVKGLTNVSAVYLGGMRSLALRTDGSLWLWGFGSSGGQGILGKNLHVPTLLQLP